MRGGPSSLPAWLRAAWRGQPAALAPPPPVRASLWPPESWETTPTSTLWPGAPLEPGLTNTTGMEGSPAGKRTCSVLLREGNVVHCKQRHSINRGQVSLKRTKYSFCCPFKNYNRCCECFSKCNVAYVERCNNCCWYIIIIIIIVIITMFCVVPGWSSREGSWGRTVPRERQVVWERVVTVPAPGAWPAPLSPPTHSLTGECPNIPLSYTHTILKKSTPPP